MNWWTAFLSCAVLTGFGRCDRKVDSRSCFQSPHGEVSIYNFTVPNLFETKNVSLSQFRGQVVLIVNLATYWGFTWHYSQLNALQDAYSEFTVLGFPCNQFWLQEPGGDGTEIWNGIRHVRPGNGFTPNFPIFKKIDVNGEKEHPLYSYLKKFCPPTRDAFASQERLFYGPLNSRDIRWNFEKFLINRHGKPVTRYDPSVQPQAISRDIEHLLMSDAVH